MSELMEKISSEVILYLGHLQMCPTLESKQPPPRFGNINLPLPDLNCPHSENYDPCPPFWSFRTLDDSSNECKHPIPA